MAEATILFNGYIGEDDESVASTVGFVRAGDRLIIIDPGMVPSPASILDPLREAGVEPGDITDVILSHHHPDHTVNAALFPNANVHDQWAIYKGDQWTDRAAEGFAVAPGVKLIETPGHSPFDIATLVETDKGVMAFTHSWWNEEGPAEDPFASDAGDLAKSRARILDIAAIIVPGHGPAFTPGPDTPR